MSNNQPAIKQPLITMNRPVTTAVRPQPSPGTLSDASKRENFQFKSVANMVKNIESTQPPVGRTVGTQTSDPYLDRIELLTHHVDRRFCDLRDMIEKAVNGIREQLSENQANLFHELQSTTTKRETAVDMRFCDLGDMIEKTVNSGIQQLSENQANLLQSTTSKQQTAVHQWFESAKSELRVSLSERVADCKRDLSNQIANENQRLMERLDRNQSEKETTMQKDTQEIKSSLTVIQHTVSGLERSLNVHPDKEKASAWLSSSSEQVHQGSTMCAEKKHTSSGFRFFGLL